MNATQAALFDRLNAFEFDEPGTELTFARRLAREQRWTTAYTARVIEEYKRFLFLAVAAGHVVAPSEDVDQAWHLHLTYTRSYWHDLCREVLRQPLHHGPTKGGAAEQSKFIDLYNQTLDSYRAAFGREPPADIWPGAEQRFGEDVRHVNVNTARNWIIPKPRWPRGVPRVASLLACGLIGLPIAAAWNPLAFNGPTFLGLYAALFVVAVLMAIVARRMLPADEAAIDPADIPALDPYQVACLAFGPVRAVQAAFASMVHGGALQLDTDKKTAWKMFGKVTHTIRQGDPPPPDAPRIEQALYSAVSTPATDLKPLVEAGQTVASEIEANLKQKGLLHAGWPPARCFVAGAIMAVPLLLGLAKIVVGLSRGRPVGFLVVACLVTALVGLGFVFVRNRQTARGKAVLESLKGSHAALAQKKGATLALTPVELGLAVGLFGVGMLAAGPLAEVHAMLPRAAGGAGCTSGGGGCGGSGCGGGGGGCGGGGCGGCGGGD